MPEKKKADPEKPVRRVLATQLGAARATIKKVKEPSRALKNLDKVLEAKIKKLKDGGNEPKC